MPNITGRLIVQDTYIDYHQTPGIWRVEDISHDDLTDLLGLAHARKRLLVLTNKRHTVYAVSAASRGFKLPNRSKAIQDNQVDQSPGDGILWIYTPLTHREEFDATGQLPLDGILFRLYSMISR